MLYLHFDDSVIVSIIIYVIVPLLMFYTMTAVYMYTLLFPEGHTVD